MELRQDFIKAIRKFRARIEEGTGDVNRKNAKMRQLFTILIMKISDETKVQFTSLFARLSFLVSMYNIPYKESFLLHSFRKKITDHKLESDVGEVAINILLSFCLKEKWDLNQVHDLYNKLNKGRERGKHKFEREKKVFLKTINTTSKRAEGQQCDEPFGTVIISYDRPDRNEDYSDLLSTLVTRQLLPLTVNLIDIEIDDHQVHYPGSIVFEPDFLYDVTSVSECFGAFSNHQTGYLLRKFLKRSISKAILIGNISNFFLDQLVYHPDAVFRDFISSIFSMYPLGIALLNDQEVREMMILLEMHFNHIKSIVVNGLNKINVTGDNCQVEPSFYSAKYGIQGRLDLFAKDDKSATIIELKSGSAFRPNSYGLSNNHFHQTLLYDMLIESVYGPALKRNNFILYSKERTNQLRYAPALKAEQREAIKERNQLYIHDRLLLKEEDFIFYYEKYARDHSNEIKGFLRTDFEAFLKAIRTLDLLERAYCNLLLKFTLRELFINKLGNEGSEKSNGLASLWTKDVESKKEQFNIINHLEIYENLSQNEVPVIKLKHSALSAELSNFRNGDLGIFYPYDNSENAILRNQVFKITILSIEEGLIVIRLRSRQEDVTIFEEFRYWNIEHDSLENGYYEMSRSIYEFAQAPKSYRDVIMCRRAPETYLLSEVNCSHHLTGEQAGIFSEIVNSKDYYLLWGPPGTGKTSVMIREIARHFVTHEKDRVLFLAYTNRAVDEICEALCSLDPSPSFIRIGSRNSTGKKFQSHLLENQISGITNRKALRARLSQEQVYVGTVASVVGKVSLFQLIKFDLAVVDEASQILETSLIGLLSRVQKFVLIGDHLQLPAIVQQDKWQSQVEDPELQKIGISQLSSSLFERMYLTVLKKGWHHAIGQLTQQGRMHKDIMSFVNEHFYNGELKLIKGLLRLQQEDFFGDSGASPDRIIYYPSKVDLKSDSIKVNEHEADLVGRICRSIILHCTQTGYAIGPGTIGVITPYRAQIAAIRRKLQELGMSDFSKISIDTVERYQGSARDIIIMSCCMNYSFQLDALMSLSDNGIDRKLNVAITRSREQFVLVGNKSILSQSILYKKLMDRAVTKSIT